MVRRAPLATVVAVALALACGCTRSNDSYCCTDPALCSDVGSVLEDCRAGTICDDQGVEGPAHTCINDPAAVTCTGPDDCAAPNPACVDRVCVPCASDTDCPDGALAQCNDLNRCVPCDDGGQCSRFGSDTCSEEGVCVECAALADPVESGECDPSEPICVAPGSCRGCTDHRQCASGACDLGSGACVGADNIAYVDGQPSDGTECTFTAPCQRIAEGIATARPYVVISAGDYQEDLAIATDVTLIGYGASQTALTNGNNALTVSGASGRVAVYGLALLSSEVGVSCAGASSSATLELALFDVLVGSNDAEGVDVRWCDLTVSRSQVTGNTGGGIDVAEAQFDIGNTVIDGNGNAGVFGGIRINEPRAGTQVLRFNTIASNRSGTTAAAAPGIHCTATSALPAFHSNIISDNVGGAAGIPVSGLPECSYQYSLINPAVTGEENLEGPPGFTGDSNLHIDATSPARDQGKPDTGLLDDLDGQARPADLPDIGADEYVAP